MTLAPFTSLKFRFYAFLSMLLLVYVHGYNLHNSYLQPFTIVEEPLRITTFLEYWIANGLLRFRIPLLFIISGYLFALHDSRPYSERMTKRLRTLGIPYLVWSAIGLLLTYCWQQFPMTAEAVRLSQLDQMGDNRPYSEIGLWGILLRWVIAPVSFQLWFIRSLLVYNALYPLLVKAVSRFPALWFGIIGFFWLGTFAISPFEAEGLLFFTLGIYLQKTHYDIEKTIPWLNLRIWATLFLISGLLKSFLAFQFGWSFASFIALSLLHKVCVFSGLVTIWFGCDRLVKASMSQGWILWSSAFGFFIYALHVPLINYSTQLAFHYFHEVPNYRLGVFIFLPLVIIGICILTGAVIRRISPVFYSLITGGRGL